MLSEPEAVGELEGLELLPPVPVPELLRDREALELTEPQELPLPLRLPVLQRLPEGVGLPEVLGTAAKLAAALPDMLALVQPLALASTLREKESDTVGLLEPMGLALPEGDGRGQAEGDRLRLENREAEGLWLPLLVSRALLDRVALAQSLPEAVLLPQEL